MNLNLTKNLAFQTLHGHSNHSDGEMTYTEVLDSCQKNQIGLYAFTDHDFVPNKDDLKELHSLNDHPVKYIIGTELSSQPPEDASSTKTIHIVGLFVDPFYRDLLDCLENQRNERKEQFRQTIESFKKNGYGINATKFKDLLQHHDSIGGPAVKDLIFENPENIKKLEEQFSWLQKQQDLNEDEERAIKTVNEFIDTPFFTEKIFWELFLNNKTRVSQETSRVFKPRLDESVKLIRDAGGISIFAHYTFGGKQLGEDYFKALAHSKRFDGIEAIYGKGEIDFRTEIKEDMARMEKVIDETKLIRSGGGDIHSLEDMEFYAQTEDLAGKTKHLIQDLLKDTNVNLEWSSLRR